MTVPCNGMQMAAQQAAQNKYTLDEISAKKLIEELLGKSIKTW